MDELISLKELKDLSRLCADSDMLVTVAEKYVSEKRTGLILKYEGLEQTILQKDDGIRIIDSLRKLSEFDPRDYNAYVLGKYIDALENELIYQSKMRFSEKISRYE